MRGVRPLVIALAAMAAALLSVPDLGCGGGRDGAGSKKRVIVLGFDGMDYELTRKLIAEGRLPNLERLSREGTFRSLGTSVPPLSPVAWSNFITGMDAGGHGIFDFFHRDPKTMIPYLSTSRTEASEKNLEIGKWQIPLSGGKVELLRRGQPFWEVLEENGVETTIIRMPANFPPSGTATRELSGMGTPDILGTYGTFFFYSSEPFFGKKKITGGKIYPLDLSRGVAEGTLHGPDNPFLVEKVKASTGFTLYVDPQEPVAKLVVGDEERVLEVGRWSDWVPVKFGLIWTQSLRGICRFYLRQIRPHVEIYVTPINFDPASPALPISTPDSYAAELADATGRFYTQGMPEDTKALTGGVFTREEFLTQGRMAGEEIVAQYEYVLDQFREGLLFYYFGNLDQVSHLMWRAMDPEHPAYDPVADPPFSDVVRKLYEDADEVIGHTLERMGDETTLIVMSDHGFASWRRSFHLNSWLRENGFLAVKNPTLRDDPGLYLNVDWSRTRAYGLGLNGLYINLRGRERTGIVDPRYRERLMEEIAGKLLQTIDPVTGSQAVTKVYLRERDFEDRGHLEIGPDLVVGYAKGTRGSNESALGEVPLEVITNNTEAWSGDHGMDHETVPGVLFTNRPLKKPASDLKNLAASILAEFGVEGFPAREQ